MPFSPSLLKCAQMVTEMNGDRERERGRERRERERRGEIERYIGRARGSIREGR